MIAETIAQLRQDIGDVIDPARRGPVVLDRYFPEFNLRHFAVPQLSIGRVVEHLLREGNAIDDLGDPARKLAGFLFFAGRAGTAFINADEPLTRRRFSAAHELGHAVLHRQSMGNYLAEDLIDDADEAETQREREANAFAAELLMPEEICRERAKELKSQYGACPRGVLAYRLASELLVSKQAMDYRLRKLEVGHA